MSFLETVREHEKQIVEASFRQSLATPAILNKRDYRMLLGRLMDQAVCESIPGLEHNPSDLGYDALYFGDKTSHGGKPEEVSLKSAHTTNFFHVSNYWARGGPHQEK